jgi:hypothetical protein
MVYAALEKMDADLFIEKKTMKFCLHMKFMYEKK